MASEIQNQELSHLRKQLAVAVRSIQWSYAIFWSISTQQQGVLEWSDGYYNGEVKTRKTMQPMEVNADKLGLKRSGQLKELYKCLAIGKTNEQATRPSASLSPEDLTNAEWYYLVCMSFTFAPGDGLPGRAFASGQHIWLCNAQHADGKMFTRSLLAKSASIQTVVCFPLLGGVIELGVTDLVMEDINLLQHVKTVFLEFTKHICVEKSITRPRNDDNDDYHVCEIDRDVDDTMDFEKFNQCGMQTMLEDQIFPFSIPPYTPRDEFELDQNSFKKVNVHEDPKADSPGDSSDESNANQETEVSYMMEGVNGENSQVQSLQFMDDDLSNCVPISMNSSDCISQTYFNQEMLASKENKSNVGLLDFQEHNQTKFSSMDLSADDLHYTRTLSAILGNTNHLTAAPSSHNGNQKSSFDVWKTRNLETPQKSRNDTPQNLLKKILFDVPLMHSDSSHKSKKNGGVNELVEPKREEMKDSRILLEKNEKLNDPSLVLRSLVSPMTKFDKAAVLSDTIDYLKGLERRVEELESRGRKKCPDIVKGISEKCLDNKDIANGKNLPINKRKACDIDPEVERMSPSDRSLPAEVNVSIEENEATIEMHVPWRERLLLEIMDAIGNLHLDAHSVKSSACDGIFSLTLKSKVRGVEVITAGIIKLAIQKVVDKSKKIHSMFRNIDIPSEFLTPLSCLFFDKHSDILLQSPSATRSSIRKFSSFG